MELANNRANRLGSGLLLIMFATLFQACSSPSPKAMIPDSVTAIPAPIQKTIRVKSVTPGDKPRYVRYPLVTDESFKEALELALRRSNYFSAVKSTEPADIELVAQILLQDASKKSFLEGTSLEIEFRYDIVVNYKFLAKGSGDVLFEESIGSDYGSRVYAATTRMREAAEGAVRENFTILLNSIATKWPKNAR